MVSFRTPRECLDEPSLSSLVFSRVVQVFLNPSMEVTIYTWAFAEMRRTLYTKLKGFVHFSVTPAFLFYLGMAIISDRLSNHKYGALQCHVGYGLFILGNT